MFLTSIIREQSNKNKTGITNLYLNIKTYSKCKSKAYTV